MKHTVLVPIAVVSILAVVGAGYAVARAQSVAAKVDQRPTLEPYPNMPSIPPIGVRNGKYIEVPASAKGPPVDAAKGYRLQQLGAGLYLITDNQIQSMFLVYDKGVVVLDAPQSYAANIRKAVAEVSDKPITHLIYSHSHADHIGGAKALGNIPTIVAHEETLQLLSGTRIQIDRSRPSRSRRTTHFMWAIRYSSSRITAPAMNRETSSSTRRNSAC